MGYDKGRRRGRDKRDNIGEEGFEPFPGGDFGGGFQDRGGFDDRGGGGFQDRGGFNDRGGFQDRGGGGGRGGFGGGGGGGPRGGGGRGAGGGGPPTLAAGEWAIKFSDVVLCSCTEGTGTSSVKTASGTMPNGTWFVMEHFDDEVWRPAIPPTNPLVLVFYTSTNCTGESYPLGLAENYHIELSDIDGDGVPDSTIELNWTELDGAPNYWFRTGSPVAKPTAGNQIVIPNANTTCAWPGPVQKSMGINGNVTILRGPT